MAEKKKATAKATSDKADKDEEEEVEVDGSKPLYIMLVAPYPNGLILQGFNNAEVYPGEPIQVRGVDGVNHDHAVRLVTQGKFAWCTAEGTHLEEEPKSTKEEAEKVKATGADNVPGAVGVVFPDYHREDRGYTGPPEDVPYVETEDTEADFTLPPVAPVLNVNRLAVVRRLEQADGEGVGGDPGAIAVLGGLEPGQAADIDTVAAEGNERSTPSTSSGATGSGTNAGSGDGGPTTNETSGGSSRDAM